MKTHALSHNKAPDSNQAQIINDLRNLGIKVYRMDKIGQGFPDILIGYNKRNYLFEIKDASKRWVVKDTQRRWIKNWTGQIHIIFNTQRILEIIEYGKNKINYQSAKHRALALKDKKLFLEIWEEREHYCINCGRGLSFFSISYFDHIKPKSIYPQLRHSKSNIQILCFECHQDKSFGCGQNRDAR